MVSVLHIFTQGIWFYISLADGIIGWSGVVYDLHANRMGMQFCKFSDCWFWALVGGTALLYKQYKARQKDLMNKNQGKQK